MRDQLIERSGDCRESPILESSFSSYYWCFRRSRSHRPNLRTKQPMVRLTTSPLARRDHFSIEIPLTMYFSDANEGIEVQDRRPPPCHWLSHYLGIDNYRSRSPDGHASFEPSFDHDPNLRLCPDQPTWTLKTQTPASKGLNRPLRETIEIEDVALEEAESVGQDILGRWYTGNLDLMGKAASSCLLRGHQRRDC